MKRLLLLITIIANSIFIDAQVSSLDLTFSTDNVPYDAYVQDTAFSGESMVRAQNSIYVAGTKVTGYTTHTLITFTWTEPITREAPVLVNKNADVIFEAGNSIVLRSSFRVEKGAHFVARVNPEMASQKASAKAPKQEVIDEEISPIQETNGFSVTPNPAHDEITIHCSAPVEQVAIYNINGQIVLQSSQTQIDLSALSQGVYIVRVLTTDGQVLQAKVLHE